MPSVSRRVEARNESLMQYQTLSYWHMRVNWVLMQNKLVLFKGHLGKTCILPTPKIRMPRS